MKHFPEIIVFSLILLLSACNNSDSSRMQQRAQMTEQMLNGNYDMSKADSFLCLTATVINRGIPYTVPNYPAPRIAVLQQEGKAVIVGMGNQRFVLRKSKQDTLQYTCQRSETTTLTAFSNITTHCVDSVLIKGKEGQGTTILKYVQK